MPRLGIMQGRLSPRVDGQLQAFPGDRWREEFSRAAEAGCTFIEWIYDGGAEGENPLSSAAGIREMREASVGTGVSVRSLCADCFMTEPLVSPGGKIVFSSRAKLIWLMDQCRKAGIRHIVLPFVDQSRLCTSCMQEAALELLNGLGAEREAGTLALHIEADFEPGTFAAFMQRVHGPGIRINYDMGNSAACGLDPRMELAAYGSRIGSVHIKDRVRNGGTVPLGTGRTDIPLVFRLLLESKYTGDFVIQAAREQDGDEVSTIARYVKQVRSWLWQAGFPVLPESDSACPGSR